METKFRLDTLKYATFKIPCSLMKKIRQYSLNNDLKLYETVWLALTLLVERNNPSDKELIVDKNQSSL